MTSSTWLKLNVYKNLRKTRIMNLKQTKYKRDLKGR